MKQIRLKVGRKRKVLRAVLICRKEGWGDRAKKDPLPSKITSVPRTASNPSTEVRGAACIAVAGRRLDAPAPLRLWHLSSLDAPTVAVVWTLAFAWTAGVRLPIWIPVLLPLASWAIYIADRLLDARAGLRSANFDRLRERHRFHWQHRRILLPLAVAASCAAAGIVFTLMPTHARERNSVLAFAALAYMTRVHFSRESKAGGFSSLTRFLRKELLVGLLFTAACALPAASRTVAQGSLPVWPLFSAAVFFVLLAWLNCHAIERWESEPCQHAGEVCFSGAEEVAEKGLGLRRAHEERPSGAKAHGDLAAFTARLKSCPDTKRSQLQVRAGFSAARKAHADYAAWAVRLKSCPDTKRSQLQVKAGFFAAFKAPVFFGRFMRGLKSLPPSGSSFPAACVLAVIGLGMAFVLLFSEPRSATLVASGSVSALLLALLDRFRSRLTPLALRVAADLVLLTPLPLLLK